MLNDNYWRITHDKQYYNFVKNYEEKITEPASEQSKQDFDNLYLKNDPVKGWENYSSLEHDLTTNRLSSYVTINVNWTKLLNQTGLSDEKINEFKQKMLHIYNIIANLYGKDNILKLLQEVIMEEQTGRTIATVWPKRIKVNNTEVNMQNMYVGPKFVNQEMINDNYSADWFASNSITSIITHEYGHAISFFMTSDSNDRSMFNCFKFDPYFSSDILPSMSQSLVEYLNKTANIADNQIKREFFPLIVVRSDYGCSYWLKQDEEWMYKEDDFFAEAFNQWLNTSSNNRTWNWELLNNFFTKELTKYL